MQLPVTVDIPQDHLAGLAGTDQHDSIYDPGIFIRGDLKIKQKPIGKTRDKQKHKLRSCSPQIIRKGKTVKDQRD